MKLDPDAACIALAAMRAITSVDPPGENGTTNFTVSDGQAAKEGFDISRAGSRSKPFLLAKSIIMDILTSNNTELVLYNREIVIYPAKLRRRKPATNSLSFLKNPLPNEKNSSKAKY
jgi:hypothetical protein